MELGKQLLMTAKNGNAQEVLELISKGAPFATDWVISNVLLKQLLNYSILFNEKSPQKSISILYLFCFQDATFWNISMKSKYSLRFNINNYHMLLAYLVPCKGNHS